MAELTDAKLVVDYLAGDEGAMNILVGRYLKPIYSFAYRLTGNAEEAEDIAQEAFVKVWKNLKKYKPEQSFGAWLYGITRNTAIDWMRKKKHVPFSEFERIDGSNALFDTLADAGPTPDETAITSEEGASVAVAARTLTPDQQTVISLHYGQGFTFAEIGRLLSKSLNTVKSQNLRALVALRRLLNKAPPAAPEVEETGE